MELDPHVRALRERLTEAASLGGGEARDLVERLAAALDATLRLALQDAVTAAADEIALELAPGSVDVRLRGASLEFVVEIAPAPARGAIEAPGDAIEALGGAVSRFNLRLPEDLKARVEQLAARDGLSANSWLVRAAAAAAERAEAARGDVTPSSASRAHLTGWAR